MFLSPPLPHPHHRRPYAVIDLFQILAENKGELGFPAPLGVSMTLVERVTLYCEDLVVNKLMGKLQEKNRVWIDPLDFRKGFRSDGSERGKDPQFFLSRGFLKTREIFLESAFIVATLLPVGSVVAA
ncbi:unnamed protein product [Cuscuta campestris]|uniref:Uncharacterized protein n=1 Tax=Cuscuta campestris TaxID=132261 RepID=A0A484KSC1_9ASTE|nr:unnamed protein product [Cuscuta campestris]